MRRWRIAAFEGEILTALAEGGGVAERAAIGGCEVPARQER